MASKRSLLEIDPDYEDVSEVQSKRRRVLEEGAKAATKKKISSIIQNEFEIEVNNKESELLNISERLEVARNVMDRLRACIIANFYGKSTQQKSSKINPDQPPMIHPAVRKFIGKAPPGTPVLGSQIKQEVIDSTVDSKHSGIEHIGKLSSKNLSSDTDSVDVKPSTEQFETRSGRFKLKKRVIVGNVSKSIPADQRDENDQATHKWMVYVRGSKDSPRIDDFVKKVWFFLHPSYRPNDLVEVSQAPFHLTRRGWGEFPVRVQLHFKDNRNKKVDIIHNLKLDRTYTGLQTLGCETVVDIEIEKTMHKVKHHKAAHTVDVKQEMDISVSNTDSLTETASVTPVKIKSEPVDDHDYGKAGSDNSGTSLKCHSTQSSGINSITSSGSLLLSHILSPVTCHVTVAHSPVQTVVSPSILSSQPLTFIPMSTALQQSSTVQKLCPVTPPKNNIVQLQAVSPMFRPQTPSPTRNVVLKGFGSISASNISNNKTGMNNIQNNVIQVSPVKCSNSKNSNFIVPQPVILTNVSGNQPATLTGLQQASPSQGVKVDKTVNQSQKSNLIFLKCTDNQGKTYLIPQQLSSSVSSLQKDLNPGQVRISTPVSQSVLLSSNIMNNKAGVRLTGQISPNQVLSNVGTVFKSSKSEGGTSSSTENGPILFIKPDNSLGKKITNTSTGKSVCLSTISSSMKMTGSSCKSFSPSQNVNVVNLKTGKQTAVCAGSPPVVRGQLKVTSQGLMQVQGQLQHQTVLSKQSQVNVIEQNRPTVNGGLVNSTSPITQQKPQPVILFPTSANNKLTVLPGKGKSLLSTSLMNLQVPQSNGNILMVNPPASLQSSIGSEVHNKSLTAENMETGKILMNGDTNHVAESSSKLHNVPANHIVIVPVSSQTNVSMVTKSPSSSTTISKHQNSNTLTSSSSATNSHKDKSDIKTCDKTMLIVLQNDKSTKNGACTSTQGQRSLSSLLMSKTNSQSLPVNIKETPVTITASNKTEKQIIVVDKEESVTRSCHDSITPEKKIMLDPKKKRSVKSTEVKEKEIIAPIRLSDYPDMLSLLRAVVKRHPIISSCAARHLHPYCAKSTEEWLSWNVGKRRASEWQRASSVRKFIISYLDDSLTFHHESVWSVKQILTWCRLHAYSPHYLEKPLHPTAIDLQAETSLPADKHLRKFASVTDSNQLLQEVTSLQDVITPADSSDEEIDILSCVPGRRKQKKQIDEVETPGGIELLPPMDGTLFVEKVAEEIGVNLSHSEVEPGYYGSVTQGMIYRTMELFMGDILRETFALKVNMGRYPDALGVGDVYCAINSHPITDFLTNKHLGVDNSGLSVKR